MVKVLIAGDYCPQARVADCIRKGRGASVLEEVMPYLGGVDYSIVNFECAVAGDKDKPITKFGPCLSCSPDGVNLLKKAGFSCATLANNHFRDYGDLGVNNTIRALCDNGIDYVGGGKNLDEAKRILYKDIKGTSLAIVNLCENEFSIATNNRGGSAPLDPVENYYQISEARKNADHVVVIVHGGHEGYQYPSPRMKRLFQWFVDLGADVVVNGHQHCFSGYELYKNAPIFYGLGNFCFDEDGSRDNPWNYGFLLCLSMEKDKIGFECVPYEQCNGTPVVRLLKGDERADFEKKLSEINAIINDDEVFEKHHDAFCESKKGYLSCVTPYFSDYTRAIVSRGWLPKLMPRKKVLNILNFVDCESHRDLLLYSLKRHAFHNKENN